MAKLPSSLQKQVAGGIKILKKGGIVAFPTDTVYGLGAGMNQEAAVRRLYQVKERPLDMALPLLLARTAQVMSIAGEIPPVGWRLIREFMPGALTLVLPKSDTVPDIITAGGVTVAIRIPDHPVPVALAEGLGVPVVGTSANLSGRPSPLTPEEVAAQMGNGIDLIIDGGRCPGGIESTIIDVTGETPVVLREGAISREELQRVCQVI
ncbi:L-threonylcarbamoyladenylate synthase [Chloroflexota bacterium]